MLVLLVKEKTGRRNISFQEKRIVVSMPIAEYKHSLILNCKYFLIQEQLENKKVFTGSLFTNLWKKGVKNCIVIHTYLIFIVHNFLALMKGTFESRPSSKQVTNLNSPTSMRTKPEQAIQQFAKGKQFQKQSSYQRAINQYLKTLMYNPRYYQAYCNMGSCYRAQGKYLEARAMYLNAINIKSDDAISHYNLANTLRVIGNYEDSIKHYEFVIKLGQNNTISIEQLVKNSLINLGICYKQTRAFDMSIECFEKSRKLDRNDESIIFNEAMTYMAILETINTDIFYELAREKALKAQQLFKLVLKTNPINQMALLKLNRISSILDKSNKNLKIIVNKLKAMLRNKEGKLLVEINQELGYVLKLLKEYQKSAQHYSQSISQKPRKSINIYDIQLPLSNKPTFFSQQQAIALINQDRINIVNENIEKMDDKNISKHVIQLAIQLHLAQNEPKSQVYLNNAIEVHKKYFTENGKEIPDQKISIQGHKLIGKILSLQERYKESIHHFEYISSQIKSSDDILMVRSSLGIDYQALGDKQKALEQYKLAMESQPGNYDIIYNIGCCLHSEGRYEQSNQYFKKFLNLINLDNKLYLPTKNLYISDCLINMASSAQGKPQEFKLHQDAWKAFKQSQQGEKDENFDIQPSKWLKYCLKWADLLEEKLNSFTDKKGQDYFTIKGVLLEVYLELLQISNCPDRDAILNNCAIIYYQEKMYVNALARLNQVSFPSSLSLNSLALTYFHLGEHIMASNTIFQVAGKEPKDQLIQFNKEVIQWVYGLEQGRLYKILENKDPNHIAERWLFGVLLIDALSQCLKSAQDNSQDFSKKIEKILKIDYALTCLNQIDQLKYRSLYRILESPAFPSKSYQIPQSVIELSLKPSTQTNIQKATREILNLLQHQKQAPREVVSLLISLFIFINRQHQSSIVDSLTQYIKRKSQKIHLQLDRIATISQEQRVKQERFLEMDDIIVNLCSRECELETKIVTIMKAIQKCYYNSQFRHPLETEYHLPRHNQTDQCPQTFNKIISIVYGAFGARPNSTPLEGNIRQMREQIMESIQNDFQACMEIASFNATLQLGDKLFLATIYANFTTKQACIRFIMELHKHSTKKVVPTVDQSSEEITLIINGVLKMICKWSEVSSTFTTAALLLRSKLGISVQSILEIDSQLSILTQSSKKAKQMIQSIPELKM